MKALSRVVDLFFEDFYEELERVVQGLRGRAEPRPLTAVVRLLRRRWRGYMPRPEGFEGVVIAVDGGVQSSTFAYGGFAAVGRACALIYQNGESSIVKRVKLYIGEAYEEADREAITRYVRMIAEYSAAHEAAQRVLERGERPLLLMDGSLRPMGIPRRLGEYIHHPELLVELLEAIASLHSLTSRAGFTLAAIAKDSTALNLHITLLREIAEARGLRDLLEELDWAAPQRLQSLFRRLRERGDLTGSPLCDTALVGEATIGEGYTTPLLLAPPQQWRSPQLPSDVDEELSKRVEEAYRRILSQPGVASTIFRPQPEARPMRVDFLSNLIGYMEPWESYQADRFIDGGQPLKGLEELLNQLAYWFCNEVEYNIPLYQADLIARFDRSLYESRYEPLIIRRLEEAGLSIISRRRVLRP